MPVLDRTTKTTEDERNPSWRNETGYPRKVMTLDGNRMQLCPPMPGLTPTIGYLEGPRPLALESLNIEPDPRIPEPHHAHLCLGALYLLLSKDSTKEDTARATKAYQDFTQLIGVSDAGGKNVPASR